MDMFWTRMLVFFLIGVWWSGIMLLIKRKDYSRPSFGDACLRGVLSLVGACLVFGHHFWPSVITGLVVTLLYYIGRKWKWDH